jgi:hypothetical protein
LADAVKDIVEKAKAKKVQAGPGPDSKRARTAGIQENRRDERHENQRREAFRVGQTVETPPDAGKVVLFPTAALLEDYSMPDITEILQRLRGEDTDDDTGR